MQDKAKTIVSTERSSNWHSIETQRKQRMAIDVYKCLHNIDLQENNENFNFVNHQKHTRNNGSLVRLPTVKTEAGRKTSIYQGGLAFNELSPELRNERFFVVFKRRIKCYKFRLDKPTFFCILCPHVSVLYPLIFVLSMFLIMPLLLTFMSL